MGKWFYLVESNCTDPTREAEFNQWYDDTHLPDILETPGFVGATRYELAQAAEGKGKYAAIYEIEAEDLDAVMAAHQANMGRKRAAGRMSNLVAVTSRGIYRQISSRKA